MPTFRQIGKRIADELGYYRRLIGHPRTPQVSRVLLGAAIAYFLSPIDLIPDFVPVLGQLDDALILPGLIWLALRLVPTDVKAESRAG